MSLDTHRSGLAPAEGSAKVRQRSHVPKARRCATRLECPMADYVWETATRGMVSGIQPGGGVAGTLATGHHGDSGSFRGW